MKFAAKKNAAESPVDVGDGDGGGWDDLEQMMRLKVQIYVDLAYLKGQMEAIQATAVAASLDGAEDPEVVGQSDWEAFWESEEADYIGEDGQSLLKTCLLYTSPSPRDGLLSRMPSSA